MMEATAGEDRASEGQSDTKRTREREVWPKQERERERERERQCRGVCDNRSSDSEQEKAKRVASSITAPQTSVGAFLPANSPL